MIRILFPLFMAMAAFLGPWETTTAGVSSGYDFADNTVGCFIQLNPSFTGACAPTGTVAQRLVAYTVAAGGFAAVLSIFGLLPVVGRLTSVMTLAAGGVGVAAAAATIAAALRGEGLGILAWGAWMTLGLALVTALAGLVGLRGRRD